MCHVSESILRRGWLTDWLLLLLPILDGANEAEKSGAGRFNEYSFVLLWVSSNLQNYFHGAMILSLLLFGVLLFVRRHMQPKALSEETQPGEKITH